MSEKIKSKYAVPVIGMISSGKSTFLNSLLGLDLLETKDDVTTKFVCIIRHNKSLTQPKFYHIKLEKEENSENYSFIKDGDESSGKENILKAISNINTEESNKAEPDYGNLFYVLETKITNIQNENFLDNYDFYDVPGLNEFLTGGKNENDAAPPTSEKNEFEILQKNNDEEEEENEEEKKENMKKAIKNEESNENMRYIKGIFKYIKTKINFGIIVVDSGNCYKPQNIQILKEIYKVINDVKDLDNVPKDKLEGKPIYDYLFVLNKIDTSHDKNKTIQECRNYFVNSIEPHLFNIEFCTFAPISSIQLRNEMLMKDHLENYFRYFFNKYIDKYVTTKNTETTQGNEDETPNIDFINFLILELTPNIKEIEEKKEKIDELSEEVTKEEFEEIKNIYETTKKEQSSSVNFGVTFEDEDDDDNPSVKVFKALYKSFKDKIVIPEFSENTKEILNFFNNFDEANLNKNKINETPEKKDSKEEKSFEEFKSAFNILKESVKVNENNILHVLEKDLKRLETIIKNNKKIYIPFIGGSSAGKSTILNDIIGYTIFPESQYECTTRGIILQYSFDGETELYNCISKEDLDFYSFEPSAYPICKGRVKVYYYLSNLNSQYSPDEAKCFFILKTPIKFFEKLDDDLKKHICLIDLPGGDTDNNRFNGIPNEKKSNDPNKKREDKRTLYEKLLKMSCSFIFINRGRALKDEKNINTLRKSFYKIPTNNKNDLLKSCLFVINMFGDLKEDERDKTKLKKEIVEYLYYEKNMNLAEITNVTYFDAKAYKEYLREELFFTNIDYFMNTLHNNFLKQSDNFLNNVLNVFNKNDNFINYCLNEIKTKVESLTFENEKGQKIKFDKKKKCSKNVHDKIEQFMVGVMQKLGKKISKTDVKKIEEFANLYEQVNNNLSLMNLFKKSNNIDFFKSLFNIINNSTKKAENEYKQYLQYTINHFNEFFSIDILNKKNDKEEESIQIRNEFFNQFNYEVEKSKNNINQIFDDMKIELKNYLKVKKTDDEIKIIFEKNNNDLEKSFNFIYDEMNEIVNKFTSKIELEIKNLNNQIDKIIEQFIEKLNSLSKIENTPDNLNNNNNMLVSDNISFNSTWKNASLISFTVGGAIGILAAIFEAAIIPGVGLVMAAVGLIGYLFSDSNKTKFIKAIDKTYQDLDKNLDSKKRDYMIQFKEFYDKLKDDYENKTSMLISDLEEIKLDKFNESKEKFNKARGLLLESNQNEINENDEE